MAKTSWKPAGASVSTPVRSEAALMDVGRREHLAADDELEDWGYVGVRGLDRLIPC